MICTESDRPQSGELLMTRLTFSRTTPAQSPEHLRDEGEIVKDSVVISFTQRRIFA